MKNTIAGALLILVAAVTAYPSGGQDDPPTADQAEIRAEAEKLLREAAAAAPALASPVNRVIVYIKVADSAWEIDQPLAVSMLGAAGEDVKRLLAQVDIEANKVDSAGDVPGRRRDSGLRARTGIAFDLRKDFVRALSTYAPEQARAFVLETSEMLTNEGLRRRAERENRNLEADIERAVALNNVDKALEVTRDKLKNGVSSEVVNLAANIYRRDQAKGSEVAEEILQKLRTATVDPARAWIVTRFLQTAMRSSGSTVPMLDSDGMRALTALLTAYVVDPRSQYTSLPGAVLETIENYSRSGADSIRAAFNERVNRRAAEAARNGSPQAADGADWQTRRENARKAREGLNGLFDEVEERTASGEERAEAIAKAREAILAYDDDRFRYENLAALAVRARRAGEEDEAVSLMKEAETFLKGSPRERSDFSASITIANAYAAVDPERAFAMLEDMIYRLNGVIDGYVRFAEYSSNGRTVESGELILNRFSRQFLGYFELPETVVSALAGHDADRLSDLADRFDRPEVRVEMKVLLAGALLKAVE